MAGRYGPDQLYIAIFAGAVIFCVTGACLGRTIPGFVVEACGYGLLVWALVRMFSRNIPARRRENEKFLKLWLPIRSRVSGLLLRLKCSGTHRFFRCPGCGNLLRVPRKKGKIEITCPRCGERFTRKT
jgi:hypothetical protein